MVGVFYEFPIPFLAILRIDKKNRSKRLDGTAHFMHQYYI